ncbi:hypothetical protein [Saccharothrix yanglingensis]|uniref:hypothetical protein n=1 Tax=Saccharothrix yanglingensis TaxID=659496 RepID=UPI0035282183
MGAVYHPERDHRGNYVPTVLVDRYDAFLRFDETRALHPLRVRHVDALEPETHPTGARPVDARGADHRGRCDDGDRLGRRWAWDRGGGWRGGRCSGSSPVATRSAGARRRSRRCPPG